MPRSLKRVMHCWAPTPKALHQPAQGWRDGGALTLGSLPKGANPAGVESRDPSRMQPLQG